MQRAPHPPPAGNCTHTVMASASTPGDRLSVDERHALIARALGGLTAQEAREHLPSLLRAACLVGCMPLAPLVEAEGGLVRSRALLSVYGALSMSGDEEARGGLNLLKGAIDYNATARPCEDSSGAHDGNLRRLSDALGANLEKLSSNRRPAVPMDETDAEALEALWADQLWDRLPEEAANGVRGAVVAMRAGEVDLNMKRKRLGDDGLTLLAKFLPLFPAVAHLHLHSNEIGNEGANALARTLLSASGCPSLVTLHLSRNQIGPEGATALAQSLHACPLLSSLYVPRNPILDVGAQAIAAALPSCPSLKKLRLARNQIGDDGALSLAANIHLCPALEEFSLFDNNIQEKGLAALARALPLSKSLTFCSIFANPGIEDEAVRVALAHPINASGHKITVYKE